MIRVVAILSVSLLLTACQARPVSPQGEASKPADSVAESFPFPKIPDVLTQPEERKAYLLEHYWDNFDFADTALVNNRDVTEQGFANYLALLGDGTTPDALVGKSLKRWCAAYLPYEQATEVMTGNADSYLYDANSPFYSESLYGAYLQAMIASLPKDDVRRTPLEFKARLIRRNRVGDTATDFSYQLASGKRTTLSATKVKGDRLLLVFYDPECESCHRVLAEMMADKALAEAVKEGKLSIVAIYTEGDEQVWQKSRKEMPQGWTIGNDHQAVKNGALYDLKAMPSLYLLDSEKRVILKDAPYGQICAKMGIRKETIR